MIRDDVLPEALVTGAPGWRAAGRPDSGGRRARPGDRLRPGARRGRHLAGAGGQRPRHRPVPGTRSRRASCWTASCPSCPARACCAIRLPRSPCCRTRCARLPRRRRPSRSRRSLRRRRQLGLVRAPAAGRAAPALRWSGPSRLEVTGENVVVHRGGEQVPVNVLYLRLAVELDDLRDRARPADRGRAGRRRRRTAG